MRVELVDGLCEYVDETPNHKILAEAWAGTDLCVLIMESRGPYVRSESNVGM